MTAQVASILPPGETQYLDSNGVPLAGGSVYYYTPNTTTLKTTYEDPDGLTPNTNPVILDSAGRCTVYGEGQYTQAVYDSLGNIQWTAMTQDLFSLIPTIADINALITTALQNLYPIGGMYFSTTSSTNPATILGFGTWTAFGAGQIMIGVGTFTDGDSNSETITAGQQLGEYQHALTVGELASHNHTLTDSGHIHGAPLFSNSTLNGGGNTFMGSAQPTRNVTLNTDSATTGITIDAAGSGTAHNNIQPSIGVYMWSRTA